MTRTNGAILAEHFHWAASWRLEKAAQYPDDPRNEQCAEGLQELAQYVEALPEDDERLRELSSLAIRDGATAFSVDARWAIDRFRFHDAFADVDDFLTKLVKIEVAGSVAMMREAGLLPFADDCVAAGWAYTAPM
jgi:hypothetical protein